MAVAKLVLFAVYFGMFGFLAYAGLTGCFPASKKTFMGRISYFLQYVLPGRVWSVMGTLKLQWVGHLLRRTFVCCCLKRNPIVQIGYLVLIIGAFSAFVWKAYPRIPNPYMAGYHKYIGYAVFGLCLVTFALASFSDPGYITKKTFSKYDNFKYSAIFKPQVCKTCNLPKVPRSKHDRVTDKCVAKFDHYCIWLNGPVGEGNYRWFLAYLLLHSIILIYGAVAAASVLLTEIDKKNIWNQQFVNTRTGERSNPSYLMILQYFMATEAEVTMIFILTVVMSVVVPLFLGYHLWLVATNTTTNETFKWGEAFWRYQRLTTHYQRAMMDWRALTSAHLDREARRADGWISDSTDSDGPEERSPKAGTAGAAPPPKPVQPVEPTNVYDRGVLANFWEAIVPLSQRTTDESKPWGSNVIRRAAAEAQQQVQRGSAADLDEDEEPAPTQRGKGTAGGKAGGKKKKKQKGGMRKRHA